MSNTLPLRLGIMGPFEILSAARLRSCSSNVRAAKMIRVSDLFMQSNLGGFLLGVVEKKNRKPSLNASVCEPD